MVEKNFVQLTYTDAVELLLKAKKKFEFPVLMFLSSESADEKTCSLLHTFFSFLLINEDFFWCCHVRYLALNIEYAYFLSEQFEEKVG